MGTATRGNWAAGKDAARLGICAFGIGFEAEAEADSTWPLWRSFQDMKAPSIMPRRALQTVIHNRRFDILLFYEAAGVLGAATAVDLSC